MLKHEPSGCPTFLLNNPPDAPAREWNYMPVRSQFDWRELMEQDDFEMYFAKLAVAATYSRTKHA
jgi:hypothetical protein